ncbi:MAG: transcription antitermination factor NusB [Proteobacteria bacterium]|nr:transcription antitermination factor NusB [Pseudomonadota bacterium]
MSFYPPKDETITDSPLTEARLMVVQGVYQHFLLARQETEIMEEFLLHRFDNTAADKKLFSKLMKATIENKDRYLQMVTANIGPEWEIDRMGLVEKSLLVVAIAELETCPKTPFKVVINEFLDVAKAFLNVPEVSFINGILNNIAAKVRPEDFAKAQAERAARKPQAV